MYSKEQPISETSGPIKFIIHGWQSSGNHTFVTDMVKSYHSIGIYNVFGVDWSSPAKKDYLYSARSTKRVGEVVGEFIMKLTKNNKKMLHKVHIVGHSLGAQVAGFAGKQVKSLSRGLMVGRITGLDAAAPLFESPVRTPDNLRITNKDARFVDGIHTNAGFFGFLSPFGDADYYVGFGGPIQPGCIDVNVFEAFVCSHIKAHHIFTRSITSKDYVATPCENPLRAIAGMCENNKSVIMGEHTSMEARGDYFH
ncbi:hypothetical protein NQ317_013767 [Molorchus minor]|uniref:Lipase domain-containing protein n=1 Tax=Molorchus minor TaxID=1323400 RepID=A0ABQ9JSX4_9CUCU|nr:hypothetical protein NQ317_013767 [Molorchus minor]